MFDCPPAPDGVGCREPAPMGGGFIDGDPANVAPVGCVVILPECHAFYPDTPYSARCASAMTDGGMAYYWVVPL